MVNIGDEFCPICGGKLKFRDYTTRQVLDYEREKNYISIRRLACTNCGMVHRELPDDILPYRRYYKHVIFDGQLSLIDDYPCDMTIKRWRSLYLQCL